MITQSRIDSIITAVMKLAPSVGATIAVVFASQHVALCDALRPIMTQFKRTTDDPKVIKGLRRDFTEGMMKSKKYAALLKDKQTRGAVKTMLSTAWAEVEGRRTRKVKPSDMVIDPQGTVDELLDETTWPQFIEILARATMALSPKRLEALRSKIETLHDES